MVGDIEAAREAFAERGVEVEEIDDSTEGVRYAPFTDPDGNSWTLQEMSWRTGDSGPVAG